MADKQFTVAKPDQLDHFDAGRIREWLIWKGYEERIAVGVLGTGDLLISNVDESQEATIRQLLSSYASGQTPREMAERLILADAKAGLAALRTKPRAQRTDVEKVVLGIALKLLSDE